MLVGLALQVNFVPTLFNLDLTIAYLEEVGISMSNSHLSHYDRLQ